MSGIISRWDLTDRKLAISMTASWAWGASLVVGISVLLNKGLVAWAIWAGLNAAALAAFAFGYEKLRYLKLAVGYKFFAIPMLAVQVFAAWMNMQAMYEILSGRIAFEIVGLVPPAVAVAFSLAVAFMIFLLIYRFGFYGSTISDQFQYALQMVFLLTILALAFVFGLGEFTPVKVGSSWADIRWALTVGLGLVAGPFLDGMQWERLEHVSQGRRIRVGVMASLLFGAYMILIGLTATVMNGGSALFVVLLFVTSFMVCSSSLDGTVAAKQYLFRNLGQSKNVAAALSVATIVAWPYINKIGAVGLQTIYSTGRLYMWVAMLVYFGLIHGRLAARKEY